MPRNSLYDKGLQLMVHMHMHIMQVPKCCYIMEGVRFPRPDRALLFGMVSE